MLNRTRNREPLTSRARACAVAAAIVAAAPIAAVAITEPAVESATNAAGVDVVLAPPVLVEAPADSPAPAKAPAGSQASGSISGVMSDPSGAVLPGVDVTLTETASGLVSSRVSDGAGSFTFPGLQPGRYGLVAALPGFATLRVELTLGAGENLQRRLPMRIGGLVETITVGCETVGALPVIARGFMARGVPEVAPLFSMPQAAPAAQAQPAVQVKPIRVGGQIRAPRKTKHVNPVCPTASLPASGAVVIIEAVIGPDGLVGDVTVLRSVPPFDQPSVDAVRQWEFTPTLLNNTAVPVIVTVTVSYQRR
jgi:TonB family protein